MFGVKGDYLPSAFCPCLIKFQNSILKDYFWTFLPEFCETALFYPKTCTGSVIFSFKHTERGLNMGSFQLTLLNLSSKKCSEFGNIRIFEFF